MDSSATLCIRLLRYGCSIQTYLRNPDNPYYTRKNKGMTPTVRMTDPIQICGIFCVFPHLFDPIKGRIMLQDIIHGISNPAVCHFRILCGFDQFTAVRIGHTFKQCQTDQWWNDQYRYPAFPTKYSNGYQCDHSTNMSNCHCISYEIRCISSIIVIHNHCQRKHCGNQINRQ